MREIIFPKNIINNFEIIKFFNSLLDDPEKEILYRMRSVSFFEASMVTYFHSINMQLYKTHDNIFYDNINKEIEAFFLKNKYAKNFNKKYLDLELEDKNKTFVEFTTLLKDDEGAFYIIERNIKNKKLINFNNELQNEFLSLVGELTNNSHEHGKTEKAYFCGQYYPKINKLSFSISNLGNTIVNNVKNKNLNLSNEKCMEWIFELGTTTRKDGTSGGQGLFELKKIVQKLKGNITVISGNDYYNISSNGNTKYETLKNKYKGTTFIIDINYNRSE
ncbi:hypothetical protein [Fusobacterium polymorphum]|uniref:hypothetical protein n=1 Tax=Fusobacterium nucleatum subsp. polymorphum TaxID=76857 RepID=UPI002B4C222C|nr:hypothetical protein [Fusobacterium polymorphum]WRL70402.1 hypothetical protein VKN81_09665 [Fusobacterium polymorphum]